MFLLRASSEEGEAAKTEAGALDLRAVVTPGGTASAGVRDDDVLIALSEAATRGDAVAADRARDDVRKRLGDDALVDAAAVIATFNTMDRIADGSGIPLDPVLVEPSRSFRAELGLGRFASASNTPAA